MFRRLRRIFSRAPLLSMILIIWLVLTIAFVIGRGRVYSEYSTEHGRLPGLSVVMRGIHDHVYPWSGNADKNDGETEDGQQAPPADVVADGGAPANTEQAQADAAAGENSAGAKDEKTADQEAQTSEKEADPAEKTEVQEKVDPLKIPETSCSKVVPAKDYGVAKEEYLSPEDTVYNTDKEGLFAPNGTYYPLQEVEDSYFADALLIGDSRTVGLYEYGAMSDITSFLARESASVYDLFDDDEKLDYTPRGKESKERTLKDLLKKTKFKKIYISVGVNELGVPDTEDYYKEYRKVVKKINEMQPDALIYIQGIMHVSKNMSSTDPVYNNKAIVQRNRAISTLANGRNIFYIDMNSDLCDKNGDLKVELTGDGIHLKAAACEFWHKFLRKHAVVLPGAAGAAQQDTTAAPASGTSVQTDSAAQTPSQQEQDTAAQTPAQTDSAAQTPAQQ